MRALVLVVALLGAAPPASSEAPYRPAAPTREFEVRNGRAFLGGHEIKIWGIRSGNGLMSRAITERFVRNLDNMAAHGINAILVYIMGSNTGWPEEWGARNGFEADGRLKPDVADRLEWLIREADARGMVVGVGVFTPRNVANMDGEPAFRRALRETGAFLKDRGLRNVFVDIMHEYNHRRVVPDLFKEPGGPAKKSKLRAWLKEANPAVEAGVCATIDRGTDPSFPGADFAAIQKTMAIPAEPAGGFTINVESHKRDNYDSEGIYTEKELAEQYGWFEDYRARPNTGFFLHAAWITGVTGRTGGAPYAEMGGAGTADDPGVRFYYEWVRDHVGRWEYPRHVPAAHGAGR
jgi:hypothetical protein